MHTIDSTIPSAHHYSSKKLQNPTTLVVCPLPPFFGLPCLVKMLDYPTHPIPTTSMEHICSLYTHNFHILCALNFPSFRPPPPQKGNPYFIYAQPLTYYAHSWCYSIDWLVKWGLKVTNLTNQPELVSVTNKTSSTQPNSTLALHTHIYRL
jgi:hypothetical protein